MSGNIAINSGNISAYSRAELTDALQSRGVESGKIDTVLKEIDSGNFSTLREMGMLRHVGSGLSTEMPPPAADPSGTALAKAESNMLNMTDVMKVLYESAKEMREADREMRHAERDMAMQQSMNAAEKIRGAALLSLCFGVASGAVSIGMGTFSAAQGAKNITKMKGPMDKVNATKATLDQSRADMKLGESQSRLQAALGRNPPDAAEITRLEIEVNANAKLAGEAHATKLSDLEKKRAGVDNEIRALEKKERPPVQQPKADAAKGNAIEMKEGRVDPHAIQDARVDDWDAPIELPESPEMRALKAQRNDLDGQIADCRQEGNHYLNPTSNEALAGGQRLYEDSAGLCGENGAHMQAYKEAEAELNNVNSIIQSKAAQLQGVNTAIGGFTQIFQASGEVAAAGEQAKGQEYQAAATEAQSREGEMADYQKTFDELIKSVQDLIKQALQSQNEINATIYRNM